MGHPNKRGTVYGAAAAVLVFSVAVVVATGSAGAAAIDGRAGAGERTAFERPVYVTTRGIKFDLTEGPHVIDRFAIDATGRLVANGEPVATGKGARGIVFTPDARFAYVVAEQDHAVYPYRVGVGGELVQLGDPVPTGGMNPFGISMAPDGRTFYVTNMHSQSVGVFAIGPTGTPVPLGAAVPTGVPSPRNLVVSPDGRFLFVSHGEPPEPGQDVVLTFPIRPDGSLGPIAFTTPIGVTGTGIIPTPDGRFLYIANSGTHDIHGFRIGPHGELFEVPQSPFLAPNTPETMAITPDSHTMFAASVGTVPELVISETGLWSFTIGDDGTLHRVGPRFDAAGAPGGVAITPDGRHLVLSDIFEDTITAYDAATLRRLPGSPKSASGVAPGANSVAVLPNQGPHAHFVVQVSNQVATFDATASSDIDGRVTRYDWDFGDGTTLTNGGPRPSHPYRKLGSYRVTLKVTDNEGCSDTLVYNGFSALCAGTSAARVTRQLHILPAPAARLL